MRARVADAEKFGGGLVGGEDDPLLLRRRCRGILSGLDRVRRGHSDGGGGEYPDLPRWRPGGDGGEPARARVAEEETGARERC